jgi:hypothetical protein
MVINTEIWQFGYWLKEFLLQISGGIDRDKKMLSFPVHDDQKNADQQDDGDQDFFNLSRCQFKPPLDS